MLKWLFSTLAFLFLALALTVFTGNAFLNSALGSFGDVETSFKEQSGVLTDEALKDFYGKLTPEDEKQFAEIEALTPAQKQIVLSPQCQGEDLEDSPFCDPRFISGAMQLGDVIREKAEIAIEGQQEEALGQVNQKFSKYLKIPLVLIGIVSVILSMLLYAAGSGMLGIQSFFGNAAWLSLLSAVSFKVIPSLLSKLVSAIQPDAQVGAEAMQVVRDIIIDWLKPALNSGFWVAFWIAIISFIVWLVLKFTRK